MKLKQGREISPSELFVSIDQTFQLYLNREERKNEDPEYRERATLLRTLFSSRLSLLEVLKEHLKDNVPWDSKDPLDASTLDRVLHLLGEFDLDYRTSNLPRLREESGKKCLTPEVLAAREYLRSPEIDDKAVILLKDFFVYHLRSVYIDDKEETKRKPEIQIDFEYHIKSAIKYVVLSDINERRKSKIVHELMYLLTSPDISDKQIDRFIKGLTRLQNITYDGFNDKQQKEFIAKHIESELYLAAPDCMIDEVTEEEFKIVVLENENYYIVPPDNFYFDHEEDRTPRLNDRFPVGSTVADTNLREQLVGNQRDICAFDKLGRKVYEGDLISHDIVGLIGTYYILRASDAIRNIPLHVVDDPSLEEKKRTAINCEYMRITALGRIHDGEFHPNKAIIFSSSDS